MRPFTTEDFLLAREAAAGSDAAGQAIALLACAFNDEGSEGFWRLPLGSRNDRLLALRERLFGSRIEAYAQCLHCGQEVELALDASAFPPAASGGRRQLEFAVDVYTVRFRLLDSSDLHAAAQRADVNAARAVLVERCVLEARRGDEAIAAGALPPEIVEQMAALLEKGDPNAEMLLDLVCPACKEESQIAFDIAVFLHAEVEAQARRILRDVHLLARGYGWREADILALTPRRRREYLDLLLQ